MTDRNKFEAMLEALINEDHEAAKDIFHNIVVGKSREIYEKLLAEEFPNDEEGDDEFGADDEEGDDDDADGDADCGVDGDGDGGGGGVDDGVGDGAGHGDRTAGRDGCAGGETHQ